jgi:DNA-binding response OmpR family regulator
MQGYDAGAEIYVVKPFDNDDLLQRVEDLLTMNF